MIKIKGIRFIVGWVDPGEFPSGTHSKSWVSPRRNLGTLAKYLSPVKYTLGEPNLLLHYCQANSSSRSANAFGASIIAMWSEAIFRQFQPAAFGGNELRKKSRRISQIITPRRVHSIYV